MPLAPGWERLVPPGSRRPVVLPATALRHPQAADRPTQSSEAFNAHRLVALGAADSLQNHYDVLGLLLSDPRLPGAVDDIIVEWGNPLYQDTIDWFIAGQPVADADLRGSGAIPPSPRWEPGTRRSTSSSTAWSGG